MTKYHYKDQTYHSFWELNRATPELVFSEDTPRELLAQLGITVEEMPDPEPTPEEKAQAELEAKIADIDRKTSALIREGFDYEVNGETYHFSYDMFDQQNFADTANACLLVKSGVPGLPQSVTWNGYKADGSLARLTLDADQFLALYTAGALAHKAACMEAGGQEKAAVMGGASANANAEA
ncbi:MAG: hypothetical protein OSJ28_11525 [Desulfovibrio sp.]|nr:hypothetical protein [Desulfovibrio sp.]